MSGWIKIHRDIARHWIFQDDSKFKWWIDLILMASWEDNKVLVGDRLVEVKRGQQIVSLSFLSKRWGKAKGTILKFLELLESDGMIERYTDRKVTVLTICKYESYQESEERPLTDVSTDCLPMTDRLLTELKKEEEVKEINITTTAQAHTHTCEEFAERFRAEGNWAEVCMLIHAKSVQFCQALFEEFVKEKKYDGNTWADYNDFKRHFRMWATNAMRKTPIEPAKRQVISGQDILSIY